MTAHARITAPLSSGFLLPDEKPAACIEVVGYGHIPRSTTMDSAVADVYLQTGKRMRWVRDDRTSTRH
ncbi:hypothetical protein [Phytohalomonas tamaricis]|uniref:hypothetical protein n=1 Tax=Phytohalomonas tamaricis TaxID=2081032 RepID=UPI000D0AFB48|nr:hypothetical protein [Phytohalomonas tamaricis]